MLASRQATIPAVILLLCCCASATTSPAAPPSPPAALRFRDPTARLIAPPRTDEWRAPLSGDHFRPSPSEPQWREPLWTSPSRRTPGEGDLLAEFDSYLERLPRTDVESSSPVSPVTDRVFTQPVDDGFLSRPADDGFVRQVSAEQIIADERPPRIDSEVRPASRLDDHYGDYGAPSECGDCRGSCRDGACRGNTCRSGCQSCGCGPSGFFWVRGEYLTWWTKGSPTPPLITISPAGTPQSQAGVLGQSGTEIVFGDDGLNDDDRAGARLRTGFWFDDCRTCGIEGEYFQLENQTTSFSELCGPGDIVARPFRNAQSGLRDAQLICFPGIVDGAITARASTELESAGLRFRRNLLTKSWCRSECGSGCPHLLSGSPLAGDRWRVDWVTGYRFLRLDENLTVQESLVSTNPGGVLAIGTTLDVSDMFDTENEFHGGEFGFVTEFQRGRWTLETISKIALGSTRQIVRINGATLVTAPGGGSANNAGGLLAQQTNIGTYDENEFAVLPEAGLTLSYEVTCNVRASVGYTFVYLSNVLRPGDQIDPVLNPSQFPPGALVGAPRPAFTPHDSDFWAQGLSFGLEWRR